MNSFYENLRKLSLGDIVAIVGLISDWAFQGMFKRELPRGIFIGIVVFLFFRFIKVLRGLFSKMENQSKNYETQRKKMLDSYKGRKRYDGWLEAEEWERKAKTKFRSRRKKMLMVAGGKIILCFLLIVIICIKNPNNVWAVYQMLTEQAQPTEETIQEQELLPKSEQESESKPLEATEASCYENQEETMAAAEEAAGEPVRILKPFTFRFVLAEPEREPVLAEDVEVCVFFMNHESDQPLEDYIDITMEEIGKCQYKGVNLQTLLDENGNSFYTYTEAEDSFKIEISRFQNEKYLDVWYEKAPRSTDMDFYMNGREVLNHIEIDGEKGNWEIWWKLANDNQYYALEYEQQTQNGDAVFYYYVTSIYCSLEALKYEMPEEKRNQIYHYAVMRYKDIRDMELEIPLLYRELASQIYDCLSENDVIKDEEEGGTAFETDVTV